MSLSPTPGRIAIVVNDLQPYGSQRVAMELASAMVRLDIEVDLITLEPTDQDGLPVAAGVGRLSVARRARGAVGYLDLVVHLNRALRKRRPDLIISHMTFANVTTLAASAWMLGGNCPVLVTDHNTTANLSIERSPRALKALVRLLYPRARRIIGVSDAVVADLIATYHFTPDRTRRIFNPVDVATVRKAAERPAPHPWLESGLSGQTVVCVGALRRAKGQDLLVAALAYVPSVRVIFVGGGGDQAGLESAARALDVGERIEFVGYRADALAFIAHAKALVVPSRWEGFGLVAVEAAALGIPVLATAVSGLSELVPDMVPGLLVAPEDPPALADGLVSVLAGRGVSGPPDLRLFEPVEVARRYLAAAQLTERS